MEFFQDSQAEFLPYQDIFSFRHQSRGRRHPGSRDPSGLGPSSTSHHTHHHHDPAYDQNRSKPVSGINGTIVDETGRHSTRWQGHCNHKHCSGNLGTGGEPLSHFAAENHIRKGPFCHEKGQTIDATAILVGKMAALYGDQELSDVQLVVGHSVYTVHKLVLCCSSDVLKVMLTNPQWPDSQRPQVVLREEPECVAVFPVFLRYIYTGVVHLDHDTAMPVLMLADKYNVQDLRRICTDFMTEHLASVVHRNRAVSWLQYAQLCAHNELSHACVEFIRCNFYKVASSPDFLLLEKDNLLYFLQDSDLVVPDEYTLFKAVLRWLRHHQDIAAAMASDGSAGGGGGGQGPGAVASAAFQHLVLEVLSAIRFPLMLVVQLRNLEAEALGSQLRDFLREKVIQGTQYQYCTHEHWQRLVGDHNDDGHSEDKDDDRGAELLPSSYRPRNFTNDAWATALSIDNFAALGEHEVQPLFFASPVSCSEADESRSWEWNADLFPKGVHFQKCIMIGLWRNLEVCGTVYNTVRLKLEAKTPERRLVDVSVLVTGVQDNVEYVRRVVRRTCRFDRHTTMYNLDEIVPFDELHSPHSPYLSGVDRNSFKITIIVKPA